MNRLQRRCFAVSAGVHAVLGLVLLVGPGFLKGPRDQDALPILTFVPDRLVDRAMMGGGRASRTPSPPTPATPQPSLTPPPPVPPPVAPAPVLQLPEPRRTARTPTRPRRTPEPEPEPQVLPRPARRADRHPTPAPAPNRQSDLPVPTPLPRPRHTVEPNLEAAVRNVGPTADERERERARVAQASRAEAERARAIAAAQAARQAQEARVANAVRLLQNELSSTTIEDLPGTGGPTYANYAQYVKSVYEWAWRPPDETLDESATVRVKVVIAHDGKVLSATIDTHSGVTVLDRSVQAALERVDNIGKPFPEGAAEAQRTFFINFNLKAKHLSG